MIIADFCCPLDSSMVPLFVPPWTPLWTPAALKHSVYKNQKGEMSLFLGTSGHLSLI